jgi:hypothetical protein
MLIYPYVNSAGLLVFSLNLLVQLRFSWLSYVEARSICKPEVSFYVSTLVILYGYGVGGCSKQKVTIFTFLELYV